MIDKDTILYPQDISPNEMYYDNEPYAYWLSVPEYNVCNWVLYKEYNGYISTCAPNDCLRAVSYEDIMEEFRTYSFYEGMDREKLCHTFRQRSLDMTLEESMEWEDFVEE